MNNNNCVYIDIIIHILYGLPKWLSGKESACQCRKRRRFGFNPWVGRSSGEGNGNPLQYSCLENPIDRGTWQAIVHRIKKSWTRLKQLSTHTMTIRSPVIPVSHFLVLDKAVLDTGLKIVLEQGSPASGI